MTKYTAFADFTISIRTKFLFDKAITKKLKKTCTQHQMKDQTRLFSEYNSRNSHIAEATHHILEEN